MEAKKNEQAQVPEEDRTEKLDSEQLDSVAGGSSPFADLPRVPLQEIDEELRKKA